MITKEQQKQQQQQECFEAHPNTNEQHALHGGSMMDFAMMNATFLIIIMMVRIAAFLWTLGIISHIVPNAFATKIVQSNTSPKSASNQIPTTSTPLYSLNAAIGIGSRMDFVMMFAIFLNLVMMVGIVVWRLWSAPIAQTVFVIKVAVNLIQS